MEKQVLSIAQQLYGGVLGPDGWRQALSFVRDVAGSESACMMLLDKQGPGGFIGEHIGNDQRVVDEYNRHYHRFDPAYAIRHQFRPGRWYIDWQALGRAAIDRDPFYQEFMRDHGLRSIHALPLLPPDSPTECFLSLQFPRSAPDTDITARSSVLNALAPHFAQAATLRHQFLRLQQRADLAQQALDAFDFPVLVVNEKGRIHLCNDAAAPWLSLPGNPFGIAGLSSASLAGARLLAALRDACAPGRRLASGARVAFGEPTEHCMAVAIPLPESMAASLPSPEPLALLKIQTRDGGPMQAQHLMRALFGISPAEYRLLELLMQEMTAKQCAQQLGLSQETVKTQIRSLLRRTHTSRQSELLKLVQGLTHGHKGS